MRRCCGLRNCGMLQRQPVAATTPPCFRGPVAAARGLVPFQRSFQSVVQQDKAQRAPRPPASSAAEDSATVSELSERSSAGGSNDTAILRTASALAKAQVDALLLQQQQVTELKQQLQWEERAPREGLPLLRRVWAWLLAAAAAGAAVVFILLRRDTIAASCHRAFFAANSAPVAVWAHPIGQHDAVPLAAAAGPQPQQASGSSTAAAEAHRRDEATGTAPAAAAAASATGGGSSSELTAAAAFARWGAVIHETDMPEKMQLLAVASAREIMRENRTLSLWPHELESFLGRTCGGEWRCSSLPAESHMALARGTVRNAARRRFISFSLQGRTFMVYEQARDVLAPALEVWGASILYVTPLCIWWLIFGRPV